jgi:putative endonuclease
VLGKKGENAAIVYLEKKGYKIVTQNFTTPFGEVDIIAWDKSTLVFIEVKARKSLNYGRPFESITKQKMKKIGNVALYYLKRFKTVPPARFDVLNIVYEEGKPQINLIKDAFEIEA